MFLLKSTEGYNNLGLCDNPNRLRYIFLKYPNRYFKKANILYYIMDKYLKYKYKYLKLKKQIGGSIDVPSIISSNVQKFNEIKTQLDIDYNTLDIPEEDRKIITKIITLIPKDGKLKGLVLIEKFEIKNQRQKPVIRKDTLTYKMLQIIDKYNIATLSIAYNPKTEDTREYKQIGTYGSNYGMAEEPKYGWVGIRKYYNEYYLEYDFTKKID